MNYGATALFWCIIKFVLIIGVPGSLALFQITLSVDFLRCRGEGPQYNHLINDVHTLVGKGIIPCI